jgi:ATP-binding cassette subfamily B protein
MPAKPQQLQRLVPTLARMVRRFAPHLRKQRHLIIFSTLAVLAEVVFRLLEPWPLKYVFDRVLRVRPKIGPIGVDWIDSLDKAHLMTVLAVALVVITTLRALSAYANAVGFALIGNRVLTDVRSELYKHLQCLSLSYHTRARGGDLIVRVISDIGMLKDVAVTAMLPLLANVLILIGMFSFMLWRDLELGLLSMATMPLFALSTMKTSRKINDAVRRQRTRESAMAATAGESMGAIKTVQALSLERKFSASFAGNNNKSLRDGVQASKLAAKLERSVDVMTAIATALVLWRGAALVVAGRLTPGDLIVFLRYLQTAFRPVRDFAKYTGRLAKASAAAERVLDVLEREPDVRDLPGAVEAPRLRGEIVFDRVTFEYEPGRPALENLQLTIDPGQHVAIVGPSGGGKTTLSNLVMRLYDPTSGVVRIDGRDLREYTLESLRGQISVVLQDSLLFAASIRDNIAYGAPDATPQQIESAARLAGAHEFIQCLPDGYDTTVGERGVTLSGGQRQRIAVARAAVRAAPIVILDEPTSGLDEHNAALVTGALERLTEGKTVLSITHDLSLASRADAILFIDDGRIVERGSHGELMRADGRYARMYRSMVGAMPVAVSLSVGDEDAVVAG